MTFGYDSFNIGNYPLGTMGLGGPNMFTTYNSFDMNGANGLSQTNPMMSMDGSIYGMNSMAGMSGMAGMAGGYNPSAYMTQMAEAAKIQASIQGQIEENQLNRAGKMHGILMQNQVNANRETDRALIGKILTNASIMTGIRNLYTEVKNGKQDGICRQFDLLKQQVYNTYKEELAATGTEENPEKAAARIIESVYNQVITAETQQQHDLRQDIEKYGDGAFTNGFMKGFRPGTHERYVDKTLNHCFGLDIDQSTSKEQTNTLATWLGRGAYVLEKGAIGGVAGVGLGTTLWGLGKITGLSKLLPKSMSAGGWKSLITAGRVGVVAGMVLGAASLLTASKDKS